MIRPHVRLASLSVLVAGLVVLAACAKAPPDFDATPEGSNALALDTPRREILHCAENDCTDWYRMEVPAKGTLVIDVAGDPPPSDDVRVELALFDWHGAPLARHEAAGRTGASVSAESTPGSYFVSVASNHPEARVDYTLTARLVQPPPPPPRPVARPPKPPKKVAPAPPPPPRFETRRAEVLEVDEDSPHGRSVLLDAGAAQGLRVGLRGRLLSGGRAIGALEIVEVYSEGCLARIDGAGKGAIAPSSVAEIEIPLGTAGAP